MAIIEAERDQHMRTVARYWSTMTERLNDPTYGHLNRTMMVEAFFRNVENHLERFYPKFEGGEHLDYRRP